MPAKFMGRPFLKLICQNLWLTQTQFLREGGGGVNFRKVEQLAARLLIPIICLV